MEELVSQRAKINKKSVLFVLVVLALAVAGFFASKFLFMERGESKEFIGQVKKVEGNVIWAHGRFINRDNPELASKALGKDVEITVSTETIVVKILMYMPTSEELEKTGGRWNPADLRQEETTGMITDLTDNKEGITIRVLSDKNIFNKSKFTPTRIEYIEQVEPNRPQ